VDCANGVGANLLERFQADCADCGLQLQLENAASLDSSRSGAPLHLNDGCGSDFVQNHRVAPFDTSKLTLGRLACSLDGDADRIVFFFVPDTPSHSHPLTTHGSEGDPSAESSGTTVVADSSLATPVTLLDGDCIAALLATHLKALLEGCSLEQELTLGRAPPHQLMQLPLPT
jgi:hypothetical protein